jgi:positive regulator of sigma E activity
MGCGQNLLNQLVGVSADIKVTLNPDTASEIKEGDVIEIGIAEGAVVAASMLAYGAPLLSLMLSVMLAHTLSATGFALLLLCTFGLGSGVLIARLFLTSRFRSGFFEPVFVRKIFLNS